MPIFSRAASTRTHIGKCRSDSSVSGKPNPARGLRSGIGPLNAYWPVRPSMHSRGGVTQLNWIRSCWVVVGRDCQCGPVNAA